MNRKQRRAQDKTGSTRELFAAAVQCHRDGRVAEAGQLYRRVLAVEPSHADSLHRLGVLAHQEGRHAQAADMIAAAIAQNAQVAAYHSHLGLVLAALGRFEEAMISCRTATRLEPNLPDLHNNLGAMLTRLGRREEAAASFRAAIACDPRLPEPHSNLGNLLLELGRPREAEDCYRNLVSLAPSFADGHASLACALLAQGDMQAALPAILKSLSLEETVERRKIFVQCVKDMRFATGELRPLLLRALNEAWDRPDDLARVAACLINSGIEENNLETLAKDELLHALLCRTANQDIALEQHLTRARSQLLQAALTAPENDTRLDFHAALARQCFINEYVFAQSDPESGQAGLLRDRLVAALEEGAAVPPSWVAAAASYFPLFSLPFCSRLLERSWPLPIEALLTQQLREPEQELGLRAAIPQLTAIADSISRTVQAQYEENPYPRWVQAGAGGPPEDLIAHLRRQFPLAPIENLAPGDGIDILVTGCGTGRNAIETTQRFKGARTLAIDLSRNSLAHAARKTPAGLAIEYAQADLLEMRSLGRRFDLIEAVGVLHHLADPFAGWRALLTLLKPHGIMLLGFYSAAARRDLPDIPGFKEKRTAPDIRRLRQWLMEHCPDIALRPDFFTISTCRDLLLHVQEHRVPLAAIGDFLRGQDLRLLGFSIEEAVLAAYRQRFPGDPGATSLDHWQAFEADHPDIFSGMYQFWLQKSS